MRCVGEELERLYPDCSKSTLRNWLKMGRVTLGGTVVKKWNEPLGRKKLQVQRKERAIHGIPVLYEDAHLVVLNKPKNLLSVASEDPLEASLHYWLKQHYRTKKVYVVHRLDRETSGVMLFALTEKGYRGLKQLFKDHDITRQYLAKVEGEIDEDSGVWEDYLVEDANYKMRVVQNRRGAERAVTHWEVKRRGKGWTMLLCTLETGKKNQIRVQAAHSGHPIVGDSKYGALGKRQMGLHACYLAFTHPVTEKRMQFYAQK